MKSTILKNLWVLSILVILLLSPPAASKVNKDKCHKLAKKFAIIGTESESGEEAQKLNDFLRASQAGSEKEKEKNTVQFCAMYFAQVNFVEANYKEMRDEKCDSFEQYDVAWRTSSDHLKNRFKPQAHLLCNGGNKPSFGSSKAFNIAYDVYIKYYGKMLGENKALEKNVFKFW